MSQLRTHRKQLKNMNLVVKSKCIGDAPTGHWGGSCMAWLGYVSCARGRYEGNVSNGQKGRGRHELGIVLQWCIFNTISVL